MGSMIKSRRTMRVYSREAGPFVPQGAGLSGPSTMTFSVQANPDELLDFSTLRLRFDYVSLFNGKLASFFGVSQNFTGNTQQGVGNSFPNGVLGKYYNLPYLNWLDDGASSLLSAARVRLNGQLLEDISHFNILDHFLIYFTASRDWMFTNGMMAGYYMDYMVSNSCQTWPGTPFNTQFDINNGSLNLSADFPFPVKQAALGATFTIPLCGLGIGRSKKFWPVLGSVLTLEFDLETWERCHAMTQFYSANAAYAVDAAGYAAANMYSFIPGNLYSSLWSTLISPATRVATSSSPYPSTAWNTNGSWITCPSLASQLTPWAITRSPGNLAGGFQRGGYTLSNAQVWVDALAADGSLTDALQKLLGKEAVGYSVPFETFETVRYDMSQLGISPGNTLDLRGRVTAQDLTSITAVFRDQGKVADFTVPFKTNTFEFPYLRWSNWVVGGQQYPAFQTGLTVVSAPACAFNTDTRVVNGTAFTSVGQDNYGLIDGSQMLNSGATEWFSLTRESLGLGYINDASAVGQGLVNPYTFMGRTGVAFSGANAFVVGSPFSAQSSGQPLLNTLPGRFALGQALEVVSGSHTGVDTMNSSNEFVLRVGIDGGGLLPTVLDGQVWEVLFLCRYNAAVVFAGGAMSVRR